MATESKDGSTAGLDAARLTPWFDHHVAGAVAPFDCTLIAGGHSNLTYRIRDAVGTSRALRRPPTGPFPRGAHDVLREARIIGALADTPVRVPPVIATCDDDSIIGAPFYVMGWVDGQIVDRPALVEKYLATPELRARAAFELVDQIAHLHKLDVDAIGLGSLGRREDYLDRQLSRLRRVWDESKTRELPIIEQLHARLVERRPPQHHTGLVHADFRFGNVMIDAEGRALAVLDWELCAIGDVLVDFATFLINWEEPTDPWQSVWMQEPPTRAGGFPNRDALILRYAERTGFELQNIDYYRAFCFWRIAVIAEGVKRRYESGAMGSQTTDPQSLDWRVRERARLAAYFLDQA